MCQETCMGPCLYLTKVTCEWQESDIPCSHGSKWFTVDAITATPSQVVTEFDVTFTLIHLSGKDDDDSDRKLVRIENGKTN